MSLRIGARPRINIIEWLSFAKVILTSTDEEMLGACAIFSLCLELDGNVGRRSQWLT
jgi:hypothetical protein